MSVCLSSVYSLFVCLSICLLSTVCLSVLCLLSVFTKEDISSLPVADAKFQEAKSDYLGPLVVTPELVAKKIKAMKDKKSPGVNGIPPK